MELPKNITQIGESDHSCKIYVEDYVISFIKQMNQLAGDKELAVALYGVRKEENDVSYLFFYGACKLDFLSREVRHLSQAQSQEIEKQRKRYFPEYQFLGYRVLNGDMVEGFHICEQGICRYINGYACFYEKNDSMLAYMLDTRKEEVPPEEVDQEKYERVRKRQEERRAQSAEESRGRTGRRQQAEEEADAEEPVLRTGRSYRHEKETADAEGRKFGRNALPNTELMSAKADKGYKNGAAGEAASARKSAAGGAPGRTVKVMRASVVGVFLLLCIVGLTTLNGYGKLEKLQVAAKQLVAEFTEKKIPDADGAVPAMSPTGQNDTLVTEDKLTDAIQKENAGKSDPAQASSPDAIPTETMTATEPQSAQEDPSQETAPSDPSGQSDPPSQTNQTGQGQQANGQDQQSADPGGQQAAGTDQPGKSSGQQDNSAAQPSEPAGQTDSNAKAPSEPAQPASGPVAYVIQKGDTLIGISIRQYGTDKRVQDICSLNNISNPDDIRFGQKILLP